MQGISGEKNEIVRKTKRRSRSKRREDVAEEERNGKLKFRRTQKTETERGKRENDKNSGMTERRLKLEGTGERLPKMKRKREFA